MFVRSVDGAARGSVNIRSPQVQRLEIAPTYVRETTPGSFTVPALLTDDQQIDWNAPVVEPATAEGTAELVMPLRTVKPLAAVAALMFLPMTFWNADANQTKRSTQQLQLLRDEPV